MRQQAVRWEGVNESSVALVSNPGIKDIPIKLGETYAGNPAAHCAGGAMQHLALRVRSRQELLAMRDRLRSRGVPVLGPLDHGLCVSIYKAMSESM